MARKYKVKRSNQGFVARLFPDSVQAFVARRIVDTTGLFLLAVGAYIFLGIASFNRADPSINTAAIENKDIQNWMGQSGAYLSDILLQSIGLGALVFALSFMAWGSCLFLRRSLSPLWVRFVAMVFGGMAAAAAFAKIPSNDWLAQPHMGGTLGMKLLQGTTDMLSFGQGFSIVAGGWALIAFVLCCAAFSLGFAEIILA